MSSPVDVRFAWEHHPHIIINKVATAWKYGRFHACRHIERFARNSFVINGLLSTAPLSTITRTSTAKITHRTRWKIKKMLQDIDFSRRCYKLRWIQWKHGTWCTVLSVWIRLIVFLQLFILFMRFIPYWLFTTGIHSIIFYWLHCLLFQTIEICFFWNFSELIIIAIVRIHFIGLFYFFYQLNDNKNNQNCWISAFDHLE